MKRKCLNCGNIFDAVPAEVNRGRGKYCSRKCSGEAQRGSNNPNWVGGKLEFECSVCGKQFSQYKSEYERIGRTRKTKERFCSRGCWAKGYYVHPEGYVYIYKPEHPDSNQTGMILEHRYVMEQTIGKRVDSSLVVHHKNGVRGDNRPENLKLMTPSEHHKLHAKEWMHNETGIFAKKQP